MLSPLGFTNNALSDLRYAIIRNMLSGPVLCNIPFIGRRNCLEWLFLLILAALIGAGISAGGEGSGSVASILGAVLIVCGLRYNVLGFFAGISFERALFWHKGLAVATLLVSLYHGIATGFGNTSGLLLFVFMVLVSVLYAVKTYLFEVFYYAHIILNAAMIFFAMTHGAGTMALGGFVWLGDLLFRYLLSTSRVEAVLEVLPADVVRISFPKGSFRYNAGQYCFVMIPELSMLEFHVSTLVRFLSNIGNFLVSVRYPNPIGLFLLLLFNCHCSRSLFPLPPTRLRSSSTFAPWVTGPGI